MVSAWLWLTVLFANFAEALAEGRGKAQAAALRSTRREVQARKLKSRRPEDGHNLVQASSLRRDDIVLVEARDIIPADGEVIDGVASVDESAITGESAPVLRESGGDFCSVTGGTRVLSDWLVVRVTTNPGEAFLDRMIAMVEGAKRGKTPNDWVSQVGMLAGTLVYVNAGTQLGKLDSLAGVLSPSLLGSFILLGIFPLMTKKIIDTVQATKVYRNWTKPEHFDNNLIVIGAGSGGLVTSYIAAAVKAKVTLVEKHLMGGDCLNTGCVPSKALIRSAKFLSHVSRSAEFGIKSAQVEFDFAEVMERVQTLVKTVAPHDSVERYTELGVNVIIGTAKIISPWEVEVTTGTESRILTTRSIVIATGAKPFVPPIAGLDEVGYLTSDTIWSLREKPERLLILGGGPIGCELAQAFARLGSTVTQVEMLPRLMMREDEEVSALVMAKFRQEGIKVLLRTKAKQFLLENGKKLLLAEYQGQEVRIEFDQVLLAIGRAANITGYGIEEMGIRLSPRKTIAINDFQETNYPNIYACGDVAGPYQFTHTAAHQAWSAAVNALFGQFKKFRTDYSVIPWSTFVDPEVARVGLNEQEAKEQGIAYEVSIYQLDELDRAIADSAAHGFVKVLTQPNKDKILGVTIVADHAGDLLAEFVLAMKHNLGLNKVLGTIHIYPTMAEANKQVAGVWKRNHAPQKLLAWIERYHTWRRS